MKYQDEKVNIQRIENAKKNNTDIGYSQEWKSDSDKNYIQAKW